MTAYFFDTSALVKRYAKETGTAWVFSLVRPAAANPLYLTRITGAEVVSALTRRERAGRLGGSAATKALARFEREFANRYAAVEVSARLVSGAMKLARTYALRGYDAVQLAAALEVHHLRSVKNPQSVSTPMGLCRLSCACTQGSCEAQQPWAGGRNRFAVENWVQAELMPGGREFEMRSGVTGWWGSGRVHAKARRKERQKARRGSTDYTDYAEQ